MVLYKQQLGKIKQLPGISWYILAYANSCKNSAWEKFNGRTRMMKGLFNYETAYRQYTRLCLEDFVSDNIQYAEIRPNFMMSNQLYHDDGTGPINNEGIMNIIIDEVTRFQRETATKHRFFGGIKVIYCTPRSLDPASVKAALGECLEFKQRWPQWIAGESTACSYLREMCALLTF